MAADLTDPNFAQPVRSLSAVRADVADGADLADVAETDEAEEATGHSQPEVVDTQDDVVEGDFLRHPSEDGQPKQRRRKAVTPHWEDVLLGVRTNTKRPKR